jgi:hypothetical protein
VEVRVEERVGGEDGGGVRDGSEVGGGEEYARVWRKISKVISAKFSGCVSAKGLLKSEVQLHKTCSVLKML